MWSLGRKASPSNDGMKTSAIVSDSLPRARLTSIAPNVRAVPPRERDEPVRLTKIYTRGGDKGETSLGDGARVSKLDARIAAFGTVDEVNAAVGDRARG